MNRKISILKYFELKIVNKYLWFRKLWWDIKIKNCFVNCLFRKFENLKYFLNLQLWVLWSKILYDKIWFEDFELFFQNTVCDITFLKLKIRVSNINNSKKWNNSLRLWIATKNKIVNFFELDLWCLQIEICDLTWIKMMWRKLFCILLVFQI